MKPFFSFLLCFLSVLPVSYASNGYCLFEGHANMTKIGQWVSLACMADNPPFVIDYNCSFTAPPQSTVTVQPRLTSANDSSGQPLVYDTTFRLDNGESTEQSVEFYLYATPCMGDRLLQYEFTPNVLYRLNVSLLSTNFTANESSFVNPSITLRPVPVVVNELAFSGTFPQTRFFIINATSATNQANTVTLSISADAAIQTLAIAGPNYCTNIISDNVHRFSPQSNDFNLTIPDVGPGSWFLELFAPNALHRNVFSYNLKINVKPSYTGNCDPNSGWCQQLPGTSNAQPHGGSSNNNDNSRQTIVVVVVSLLVVAVIGLIVFLAIVFVRRFRAEVAAGALDMESDPLLKK